MPYTIKITKTGFVTRTVGKEWKVIGKKAGEDEYGYTPEIEKSVEQSVEVLSQTVDDMDLPAVIKAVNRL